ncbi:hypothetical protein K456DRAFT_28448 [Colletotrichum gloeosporioides 23]|nr:hypothetical protein K456DRAFT_28448 [Colletotrichum gloeosporioides 23]
MMFKPFSELPTELRLMIWAFAIQQKFRGAHFFSVGAETVNDDGRTKTSYFLTPPDFSISHLSRPWSENDISLCDYGLWYACKESRLVIAKHFRRTYSTLPQYGYLIPGTRDARLNANHYTGTRFVRYNGRETAIPFLRRRDMTCLQVPPSLKIHDIHDIHDIQQELRQLGCIPNTPGSTAESFAFEYDASWAFNRTKDTVSKMRQLPGPRGLFLQLLRLIPDQHRKTSQSFWGSLHLIQYGATLKSNVNVCRYRSPFNGNGYTFIEARRENVEEGCKMEMNAWEFLDAIISQMKPRRWNITEDVSVLVCKASTTTRQCYQYG